MASTRRSGHGTAAGCAFAGALLDPPVDCGGLRDAFEPQKSAAAGIVCVSSAGALSFRQRLEGLGLAGVVAYGILNTLYYTAAFFFVWKFVARVPRGDFPPAFAILFAVSRPVAWAALPAAFLECRAAYLALTRSLAAASAGLGLASTARKFAEVIGITWAGSQVTKVTAWFLNRNSLGSVPYCKLHLLVCWRKPVLPSALRCAGRRASVPQRTNPTTDDVQSAGCVNR